MSTCQPRVSLKRLDQNEDDDDDDDDEDDEEDDDDDDNDEADELTFGDVEGSTIFNLR